MSPHEWDPCRLDLHPRLDGKGCLFERSLHLLHEPGPCAGIHTDPQHTSLFCARAPGPRPGTSRACGPSPRQWSSTSAAVAPGVLKCVRQNGNRGELTRVVHLARERECGVRAPLRGEGDGAERVAGDVANQGRLERARHPPPLHSTAQRTARLRRLYLPAGADGTRARRRPRVSIRIDGPGGGRPPDAA